MANKSEFLSSQTEHFRKKEPSSTSKKLLSSPSKGQPKDKADPTTQPMENVSVIIAKSESGVDIYAPLS